VPLIAVDAAVFLVDAMAGDAGDPFTGDIAAIPQGQLATLAHRRADARVAAQTKRSNGPLGEVIDALFELVKHRRDGSVGVGREAPFIVDLFVTGAAGRGARITGFAQGLLQLEVVRAGSVGGDDEIGKFSGENHPNTQQQAEKENYLESRGSE
jgi:hypothetical protein